MRQVSIPETIIISLFGGTIMIYVAPSLHAETYHDFVVEANSRYMYAPSLHAQHFNYFDVEANS